MDRFTHLSIAGKTNLYKVVTPPAGLDFKHFFEWIYNHGLFCMIPPPWSNVIHWRLFSPRKVHSNSVSGPEERVLTQFGNDMPFISFTNHTFDPTNIVVLQLCLQMAIVPFEYLVFVDRKAYPLVYLHMVGANALKEAAIARNYNTWNEVPFPVHQEYKQKYPSFINNEAFIPDTIIPKTSAMLNRHMANLQRQSHDASDALAYAMRSHSGDAFTSTKAFDDTNRPLYKVVLQFRPHPDKPIKPIVDNLKSMSSATWIRFAEHSFPSAPLSIKTLIEAVGFTHLIPNDHVRVHNSISRRIAASSGTLDSIKIEKQPIFTSISKLRENAKKAAFRDAYLPKSANQIYSDLRDITTRMEMESMATPITQMDWSHISVGFLRDGDVNSFQGHSHKYFVVDDLSAYSENKLSNPTDLLKPVPPEIQEDTETHFNIKKMAPSRYGKGQPKTIRTRIKEVL